MDPAAVSTPRRYVAPRGTPPVGQGRPAVNTGSVGQGAGWTPRSSRTRSPASVGSRTRSPTSYSGTRSGSPASTALDPYVRWEDELVDPAVLADFKTIIAAVKAKEPCEKNMKAALGKAKTVHGVYAAFVALHSQPILVRFVYASVHPKVFHVFSKIQTSLIKVVNEGHLGGFILNSKSTLTDPPIIPLHGGVAYGTVVSSTLPLLDAVSFAIPYPCIELSESMKKRLGAARNADDVFQSLSTFCALSQLLADAKVQDLVWAYVVAFCLDLYPYVHTRVSVMAWPAHLRNSMAHNQASMRSVKGDMLLYNVPPTSEGRSHDWVMSIQAKTLINAISTLCTDLLAVWGEELHCFAREGSVV